MSDAARPKMKVRGKHRKARRTVYDVDGRVVSRTWVGKPRELGPLKLTRAIRMYIDVCPGVEDGCRHCLAKGRGWSDWDSEEDKVYDEY